MLLYCVCRLFFFFFFQAEDGIRDLTVTGVQTCALPICEYCYSRRPALDRHLAEVCVRGLKRRRFSTAVIDGMDHSELGRAKLLGAAAEIGRASCRERV